MSSTSESMSSERPLSPVLNSSKLNRRILSGIRRNRSKINQVTEILKCSDPTQRLKKIEKYDETKRRLYDSFYTALGKRHEFDFKKPIPVKDFTKKAAGQCSKTNQSCLGDISVNFDDSIPPVEGETPKLYKGEVLHQVDAAVEHGHLIDTIKQENEQLRLGRTTNLENFFLGFEDFEIKLATKLFSKITAANPEFYRNTGTSEQSNFNCIPVGEVNIMDKQGEIDQSDNLENPTTATNVTSSSKLFPDSVFRNSRQGHKPELSMCDKSFVETRITLNESESASSSYNCEPFPISDCPTGFSTASGKHINISESSINKAEKLLSEDVPGRTKSSQIGYFDTQTGFSTVAGRDIGISSQSLQKANKLFSEDFGNLLPEKNASAAADLHPMFSTASGKNITISENSLNIAEKLFVEDFAGQTKSSQNGKCEPSKGSAFASGSSSESLQNANKLFSQDFTNFLPKIKAKSAPDFLAGFSTASGKNITISENTLNIAERLFAEDFAGQTKSSQKNFEPPKGFAITSGKEIGTDISEALKTSDFKDLFPQIKVNSAPDLLTSFSIAYGKNIETSKSTGSIAEKLSSEDIVGLVKGSQINTLEPLKGFSKAGGKEISISSEALQKANELFFQDFDDLFKSKTSAALDCTNGFTTATGKKIMVSSEALIKANSLLNEDCDEPMPVSTSPAFEINKSVQPKLNATPALPKHITTNRKNIETPESIRILLANYSDLKEENYNINSDIDIDLDETSVNNTKEMDNSKTTPRRAKKRLGISGCKQIPISCNKLQKVKHVFDDIDVIEPVTPTAYNQASKIFNSTPIKLVPNFSEFNSFSPVKKSRICHEILENNLNEGVIVLKQQSGDINTMLEEYNGCCAMLENKLRITRERIVALKEQTRLTDCSDDQHKRQRRGILLHKKLLKQTRSLKDFVDARKPQCGPHTNQLFKKVTPQNAQNVHFNDACFKDVILVSTEDGACVIPNASDLIGLSEIKSAFRAMPGVDPKLIPNNWIENHFKLIVWKFVSYERSFPNFLGCLNVENVVQQLKYRYDREIDLAERSALHRILEKDDVPQKRMVLCVSNIYKVGNAYELELCDGWYCIRTIIDHALCYQIKGNKIVIGTKLITQYAELLDCDGCHPLEVPEHVRLKINFNCTRRASWFAKLGYQHNPQPFPISLESVNPDGGIIGCVTVHIARTYPPRFMEKQPDGKIVWRNNKAEEKYAQQWEHKQMKEIEIIRNKISSEYETVMADDDNQLSTMSSQAVNKLAEQQCELSTRLSSEIGNLKQLNRNVTLVVKFRIVDFTQNTNQGFIFNIWKAREEHISELKEGKVISIYNIMPRHNGELTATPRTYFKQHSKKSPNHKLKRQLLPIAVFQTSLPSPIFNEFDTVGTIVRIFKEETHQELWLSDFMGHLLLVRIKEGSDRCCLLDSVNREQHVAVLNLIFCKPQEGLAQAVATQCSVVTRYPSQAFLKDSLALYVENVPKNLNLFLTECDAKIDSIKYSRPNLLQSTETTHLFNDTLEDPMEIPLGLTSLDVAMSLINTDQYH